MERQPVGVISGSAGEEGYESSLIVAGSVKPELIRHENLSRRQQLILLQERYHYEGEPNLVHFARLVGVDEKQIRRNLSRRGVRYEEWEIIKPRIENLLKVSDWCVGKFPDDADFPERRASLMDLNRRIEQRYGINPLNDNRTELLVTEIEASEEFHRQQVRDVSF
jgi:hypothetical protein